jgi:hypothetical protein
MGLSFHLRLLMDSLRIDPMQINNAAQDSLNRDSLMKDEGFRPGAAGLDRVAVGVPTLAVRFRTRTSTIFTSFQQ